MKPPCDRVSSAHAAFLRALPPFHLRQLEQGARKTASEKAKIQFYLEPDEINLIQLGVVLATLFCTLAVMLFSFIPYVLRLLL